MPPQRRLISIAWQSQPPAHVSITVCVMTMSRKMFAQCQPFAQLPLSVWSSSCGKAVNGRNDVHVSLWTRVSLCVSLSMCLSVSLSVPCVSRTIFTFHGYEIHRKPFHCPVRRERPAHLHPCQATNQASKQPNDTRHRH